MKNYKHFKDFKINILGTEYTICSKDYNKDAYLNNNNYLGYCDQSSNIIVICYCDKECVTINGLNIQKRTLRHEIIHAFLGESGLDCDSLKSEHWAVNEEMIDFFARQWHKLNKIIDEAEKKLSRAEEK